MAHRDCHDDSAVECVHCGDIGIDIVINGDGWHNRCYQKWLDEYAAYLDATYSTDEFPPPCVD